MAAVQTVSTRLVHAVFVGLLLLVILPSRVFSPVQPASSHTWWVLGSCAVLAEWFLLWRVCAARPYPTFLALAVGGVFLSAYRFPLVGGVVYLFLLLIHLHFEGVERASETDPDALARRQSETSGRRGIDSVRDSDSAEGPCPRVELVDLDPLAAPYGRLLFTIRTARAVVAGMMVPVLTTVPDAFVSTVLAGYGAFAGIAFAAVVGVPLTLLALALGLLYFKVLRLVWSGSVGALWTCFVLGVVVVPWAGLGLYLDTSLQDVVDGRVWFHAVDYAMHHLLLVFLAFGTAFVVRRRQHEDLLALLRDNRRRDWRTAMLQVCGVVWPRAGWRSAMRDSAVGWSLLAFLLEGVALTPILSTNTSSADGLWLIARSPDSLNRLQGHYFSLLSIVCLFLPGLFLWTQSFFQLADAARRRGRRAALRAAGEARREDDRPPVLFLRSFEDDQVSLRSASAVAAVRLVDPSFEHAHIEDVLQTCLSIGPVIAVGRPTDTRPPEGVPRLYVPGAEWQAVVSDLMGEAALIVVGVSESAGLIWEIERLVAQGHLDKTVFIVPPEDARNERLLFELVRRVLPAVSPRELATISQSGTARAVAVTCADDRVRVFATARRLSQVQYELALRLGVRQR